MPYLDIIIGPTQSSFLAKRRVTDNAIIVQKYISYFWKMRDKEAYMILKIDLDKAFNRKKWSFIYTTFLLFNFPRNLT